MSELVSKSKYEEAEALAEGAADSVKWKTNIFLLGLHASISRSDASNILSGKVYKNGLIGRIGGITYE